jgi:hypothetical protein
VLVTAETDREVTIRLEPAVAVSGRLHGAGGGPSLADGPLSLRAVRAGGEIDAGEGDVDDDDGTFSIDGLRAGQAYDLVFAGRGLRTTTVRGVVAPAEGLDVTLTRLPVLHGAVGFARGESCPIRYVTLSASDDGRLGEENEDEEDANVATVDARCRFELPIPDGVARIKAVAVGVGWHLEEAVAVPSQGDPDFLCLNPPCRTDDVEGQARLRVTLQNAAAGGGAWIHVDAASQSCAAGGASCELFPLPIGEPIEIDVAGGSCDGQSRTMILSAGENVIDVPCAPRRLQRRVQGVVRTAAGNAPQGLAVRCAGGDEEYIHETLVFTVKCPRDVSTLEYQLASDGVWTAVPIPDALDPALVEIAIGRL